VALIIVGNGIRSIHHLNYQPILIINHSISSSILSFLSSSSFSSSYLFVDMTLMRAGVDPRWKGLEIRIPVISTTSSPSLLLVNSNSSNSLVTFSSSPTTTTETWNEMGDLKSGQGWPRSDKLSLFYFNCVSKLFHIG